MTTAKISWHARMRCQEMGLSTKVAKRIVRDHTTSWQDVDGRTVATSEDYPDVTVVFSGDTVVTVLWRTQDTYDRATYQPS